MGLFLRSKAGLTISVAVVLMLAAGVVVAVVMNSGTQRSGRHSASRVFSPSPPQTVGPSARHTRKPSAHQTHRHPSHHARGPSAASGAHWLITHEAITELMDSGAARSLVANAFGGQRAYVIDDLGPPGIGTSVATFTSYSSIQQALASGRLPGSYTAVIYDNEHWAGTPLVEQRNPARYERLVGKLLHRHGLLYIATPALDLVSVLNPSASRGGPAKAYLSDGIAADAARYADVIDIQAQHLETVSSEYASFVAAAAAQARKANPHVVVLAGLRSVRSVTPGELSVAYSSVRSVVNGYWLNIPGPTRQSPGLPPVDPQPALELLKQIYG
jgi:hypothetical protein